ncbi:MAG: cysteine desulfurase [Bacteroidetes bacterium]|nr:cysteine desulfurase [Bacteroidota bacterium]MBU1678157.1 cysteine desulfurase [Bacteroidota bacterium]
MSIAKEHIYLDNAATTKIHPKVFEKMLPYLNEFFGNPSSIHSFGRKTRVALEESREVVADFVNAEPSEIYFCGTGTESINFILHGISFASQAETSKRTLFSSSIEHHAVLESFKSICENGYTTQSVSVNDSYQIDFEELKQFVDSDVLLGSIMNVNNETGSIQPINKIAELLKESEIFFHTDAVQSFGKIEIDVKKIGVTALSASSHKIYGPKGVGCAYVKSGTPLSPLIHGGSQERNRRGGTENIAGIVGFAEAVKIAKSEMKQNEEFVLKLKRNFIDGLNAIAGKNIFINSKENTSPYILSVTFDPDFYKNDAESMLMFLDINGIAASNGAACNSGTIKASHVILAGGKSESYANGTLRFSFAPYNTEEEITITLDVLQKMVDKFRK